MARLSPTLPPSASSASRHDLPAAHQRDADVAEGGGDRRVRLVDRHLDALHAREGGKHRVGDAAGGGLDQPESLRGEGLRRAFDHLVVGDGVDHLVGARRRGEIDGQIEIDGEGLPDLGLVAP